MKMASAGVKYHLALGVIDIRKGKGGLTALAQGVLKKDAFADIVSIPQPDPANENTFQVTRHRDHLSE